MKQSDNSLRDQDDDHRPLPVPVLARHARVSEAFIRLCFSAGCPSHLGRLSQAELLDWLIEHYDAVRALSGLQPFSPLEGLLPDTSAKIRMANAILTILDFGEQRCSCPHQRRLMRTIRRSIDRSLDCA